MRTTNIFLVLLGLFSTGYSHIYFVPPADWQLSDPLKLAKSIEISFLGKPDPSSGFCPSINLATEKINVSAEDYLQIVKKLHLGKSDQKWRDLGFFETNAGKARLFCIDTKNQQGDLRLLQLIYVKDKRAYVLTGGMQKKDFLTLLPTFKEAFRSLTYTADLFSEISDPLKRETLQKTCAAWKKSQDSVRSLEEFEKQLSNGYAKLGAHWQFLLMRQLTNEKNDHVIHTP